MAGIRSSRAVVVQWSCSSRGWKPTVHLRTATGQGGNRYVCLEDAPSHGLIVLTSVVVRVWGPAVVRVAVSTAIRCGKVALVRRCRHKSAVHAGLGTLGSPNAVVVATKKMCE